MTNPLRLIDCFGIWLDLLGTKGRSEEERIRSTLGILVVLVALVFATGAASKSIAVTVEHPGARQAVVQALTEGGHEVRDVLREWTLFHGLSPLTLGTLDAPRPAFWPGELSDAWERGMWACRDRAGKPPWGVKNREAFLCGRELAKVLWQLWLDHVNPDVVLVIESGAGSREGQVDLEAAAHGPAESSRRVLSARGVPDALAGERAVGLAVELLAGKGRPEPRLVWRALPRVPFVDAGLTPALKMGSTLDLPAVSIPAGCDRKFPALRISPASAPLAGTISRQWDRTVAGRRAAGTTLSCKLSLVVGSPVMAGVSVRRIEAFLKCGLRQVGQNAVGLTAAHGHEKLSQGLVEGLLRDLCQ